MQAWEWALELKTETFEWWVSPKGEAFGAGWSAYRNPASPVSRNLINRVEARKFAVASPFYVTGEMCDLMEHAAQGFPPTKLRAEDLPVPNGFVLLARPHIITDVRGSELPIHAFAWGLASTEESPEESVGLHLSLYSRLETDPERSEVEETWGQGFFPTLSLLHETAWHFDTDYTQDEPWGPGTLDTDVEITHKAIQSGVEMLRLLHTFFILSWQRIAEPMQTQATRPVRKRTERALPGRPVPDVRVVQLRRYREDEGHEVDPELRGREYSHRFIVNGFWRKQWYPSEQRHKPKWIAPYVKGPKDRPLVVKDSVFLWRR